MPELIHPGQLDPRLADLQRPQHTGFTAGLCRALAQRWRVDPIVVRLAAVALALAGGVGIAIYAWGWLLTPRVGGQPPILRWIPSFSRWASTTQMIVVAVSSLLLILSGARQTGVAWGPVIVVAVLAWALARKRRNSDGAPAAQPPSPVSTPKPGAAPAAGETVEQWRTRIGTHAGSTLPTVDLYAPEPAHLPTPVLPSRQTHSTSWWGGAAVLVLAGSAAAVPFMLGVEPAILWACVAAGSTAAVALLVWAMVARNRRMPGALLILALVGAVGSGMLAVTHSEAASPPLDPTTDAIHTFVGDVDGQLDLTSLPSSEAATVTIDATASVVTVRLAQDPGSVTLQSDTIHVERPASRGASSASQLDLVIEGDFSVVELVVTP